MNRLQVTSLARTFVDLAPVLTPEALEIALDHAHRRRESLRWLTSYLPKLKQPRRAGMAALREAIGHQANGHTDSPLEVEVRRDLRRHRVCGATLQHEVFDKAGYVMRIDFAFLAARVALHVDSTFHLTVAQMNKDAEQRARLTVLGWRHMVVTKALVRDDRWIVRLKALLGGA